MPSLYKSYKCKTWKNYKYYKEKENCICSNRKLYYTIEEKSQFMSILGKIDIIIALFYVSLILRRLRICIHF